MEKNELLSTIVSDCKNNIDNEIYVYPNPNNGEEVIISTSSVMDEAFIFIYDAAGRLIREFKFLEFGGENVLKFKPKLEPGAYVIKIINSNNEYKYFKIIVN
ncbi:MAG: T9SS type A sorting domain-containing protein [Bacteroidales bacterium]|jgi:hypothetical protein|nr:T9SS type A sorting domain-containing protein [Bacteroidales bacterium]